MLPELSVGPFVSLPTYFVYLSLLSSAWIWFVWKWADQAHERQDLALNVAMLILIAGVIGGRLMHILFEAPEYFLRFPVETLKFWRGGFVIYGGFFTSLIAAFAYLKWQKQNFAAWFDFFAPLFALGYGLGRGACLLAGCCYGKVCFWPWAINGRHPTQAYAIIIELIFAYWLFKYSLRIHDRKTEPAPPGAMALMWLGMHGCGRLIMEHYRDDFRGAPLAGLSISSWISLVLVAGAAAGLFYLMVLPRFAKNLKSSR